MIASMAQTVIDRILPHPDGTALVGQPERLRQLADEHGVVLIRNAIDRGAVEAVRWMLLERCRTAGWLKEGQPMADARAAPGIEIGEDVANPVWKAWYQSVQRLRPFHALSEAPVLQAALAGILGGPVYTHLRHIARSIGPTSAAWTTPPHQDYWYIGGTPDTWTAWIPIGDCPETLGGLAVLPGSHKRGVLPKRRATGGAGGLEVDGELPTSWTWEPLRSGDALLFHSYTVHQGRDNRSQSIRLSADMRFQRRSDPIRRGSLEVHLRCLTWPDVMVDWASGDPLRAGPPADLRIED
ncbi:phytanoyl-CoA dioxygenase [Planctomycetota bacterium]|nr:phytanoyl-CoA dioxygenase [Planctomycetota bacterium]